MAETVLDKIEALLRAAGNRGFGLLEYAEGALQLRVTFEAGTSAQVPEMKEPVPAPVAKLGHGAAIVSPGVGFLRCVHPAGMTLPGEGEAVAAGAVVALIRAGPLLQPVTAARAGRLGRRLVADGAGVGFSTALFELD